MLWFDIGPPSHRRTLLADPCDRRPVDGTWSGGDGAALVELLRANPGLHGELIDVEPTTRRATNRFRNAGITARAKATVGSFFDELPAGRDTYLLAHVLHDWPDADATRILQRVAEAAPRQVVVVERITSGDTPTFRDGWSDLRMRLLFGSGERTLHDWTQLTVAAGFTITEIHPWDDSGGAAIVLRT